MNGHKPIKVHNVILARNERDGQAVQAADKTKANWDIITRESQLYGMWVGEWVITQMAADGMGDTRYLRMVNYLRRRQAVTESLAAQVNPNTNPRSN